MGKFKVGDRVRFSRQGRSHQTVGFEDVVRALGVEGDPIVSTDPVSDVYGWSEDTLELVSPAPDPSSVATLRDQFAMAALTGLLANSEPPPSELSFLEAADFLSQAAYKYADAMIEARK